MSRGEMYVCNRCDFISSFIQNIRDHISCTHKDLNVIERNEALIPIFLKYTFKYILKQSIDLNPLNINLNSTNTFFKSSYDHANQHPYCHSNNNCPDEINPNKSKMVLINAFLRTNSTNHNSAN